MNKYAALAAVEKERDKLASALARWVRHPADVEDAIQRAYLKVLTAANTDIENPFAYVYTIATRIVAEEHKSFQWKLRQCSVSSPKATSSLLCEAASAGDEIWIEQLYGILAHRLRRVSERTGQIYVMAVIEEHTYDEIAKQFNITASGVKHHLTEARKAMLMTKDEFNRTKAMYDYARMDRVRAQEALKRAQQEEDARARELAQAMLKATEQVAA
jgi:RNA polymerase sigma factor (sigma-70 family)